MYCKSVKPGPCLLLSLTLSRTRTAPDSNLGWTRTLVLVSLIQLKMPFDSISNLLRFENHFSTTLTSIAYTNTLYPVLILNHTYYDLIWTVSWYQTESVSSRPRSMRPDRISIFPPPVALSD